MLEEPAIYPCGCSRHKVAAGLCDTYALVMVDGPPEGGASSAPETATAGAPTAPAAEGPGSGGPQSMREDTTTTPPGEDRPLLFIIDRLGALRWWHPDEDPPDPEEQSWRWIGGEGSIGPVFVRIVGATGPRELLVVGRSGPAREPRWMLYRLAWEAGRPFHETCCLVVLAQALSPHTLVPALTWNRR